MIEEKAVRKGLLFLLCWAGQTVYQGIPVQIKLQWDILNPRKNRWPFVFSEL
jgi:hypothetical protein